MPELTLAERIRERTDQLGLMPTPDSADADVLEPGQSAKRAKHVLLPRRTIFM